jgi:hypothetical protein
MFLERLFGMTGDDRLSGKEWSEFGKAMTALLENRQRYETLRAEWETRAKAAADAVRNDKALDGNDGERIAQRMCEILGIEPPTPPGTPGSSTGGSDLVARVDKIFGMGPERQGPSDN